MFVADSKKNSLTDFTQLLRLDAVADPDRELLSRANVNMSCLPVIGHLFDITIAASAIKERLK